MPSESKTKKSKKVEIEEDIKLLVTERLNSLPKDMNISVGSKGSFTREELIEEVEKESEVGRAIVEIQMNFLQSLKTGEIYEQEVFSHEA